MDDPNQFRAESRRELRKRKTMNRLLNTAIGIVVVLIGVFLFALLFQDDEPVADDEFEEDESEPDVEEDAEEEEAPDEEATEPEESPDNGLDDEDGEDENAGNDTEADEEGDNGDSSPPEDGDFEPIGTEQEDFEDSFDSDSQNWDEMIAAIEYATGISEDEWSTLIWLGSGDGPGEAEGTIVHDDTEYVVTMEWVDDEGWMPTNVEEN